jgi:hypothetical protein
MVAVSLGVYVSGITWLARKEAIVNSDPKPLWFGTALIAIGVAGFMFVANYLLSHSQHPQRFGNLLPWLFAIISYPVMRRAVSASLLGTPKLIQPAVIAGLRTIIVFDAALCLLVAPDWPEYALTVIGLFIPTIILGRWIKPT